MPRKGENIYKRKDGRWEGRYIKERGLNHRAIYGYLYGKSYTEVRNKLKQINPNEPIDKIHSAVFEQIVFDWLENKKLSTKESTLSHYKSVINNRIIPILGKYEISDITADVVQSYMNSLIREGLASKTVSDILAIIKNILKYANCKGIGHNCDLSFVSIKCKKCEIETLTIFEQQKLCTYLIKNMDNKNFGILLSLYTGIRIGELCALKWSDIDIRERLLSINKTMLRIQDNMGEQTSRKTRVIITSPKSEDSLRRIPIPETIIDTLLKLKQNSDCYILTGSSKQYIEPRNMQYYFKNVLKICNIRNVKFHVLRHTFATRCVENGFEIKSLSEILGHSNVKITLERYVHSSMDLKRKSMDKLNFLSE
ncbi:MULTISPECIES: site-specific integrase [unclassified Ruminococcus]|uniref:tyrosine-type recombinase/integrase n=1 Tax=unclassified Ruminococcus TaxID=2608920 RepID=UPI0021093C31|nr:MULTISPECIES: site-specific integrase [unclassified Ruminococcus]MCQ4021935.1 tyrosine-type recombinase/integrase [Ruminococcus sp. zg-924]MCQ4114471.1 tyrosine-type recombinase/integrase [Ruminococcus sp. zg-921]